MRVWKGEVCRLSYFLETLLILAILVAPADILVGRLVEVTLQVVERVLGNVTDADTLVLPHSAAPLIRLNFASKALDHRRFPGAVAADTGDTRRQRYTHRDTGDGRLAVARVRERDIVHLKQGTTLRFDTRKHRRLGELELELGFTELKV